MSSAYFSCDDANLGRCSWVKTSSTPSTASASATWTRLMRPLAMVDETTTPWASPGTLYSAAYFAAPVTLAGPSTREIGLPNELVRVMALHRLTLCACQLAIAAPRAPPGPAHAEWPDAPVRS